MTTNALSPPYDAPPIIEAVIQFQYAEPVSKVTQTKLLKRLKREYANELALQTVEASVDFGKRQAAFAAEPKTKLSSHDETDVLIIDPTTLTWSRLAPYQGWNSFFERVKSDADIAHNLSGYRQINQLGVRYVNRIDVPGQKGVFRYEDYLTINLSLPENWDSINNYGWRLEKIYPELGLLANIQSAIIAPEIPNHAAFLLDIDVIRPNEISAKIEEVFLQLEKMRCLKNEIFELSITDTARASFKK